MERLWTRRVPAGNGRVGPGRVGGLFAALLVLAVGGAVFISPSPSFAQPTSTTTLEVSPSEAQVDEPVTLVATVTCTAGTPTGIVDFVDFSTGRALGSATLVGSPGRATLTVRTLTVGTHNIRAAYRGQGTCPASFSGRQTVTVVKHVPDVSLEVSSTNLKPGEPVTLTALVSSGGNGPTIQPVGAAASRLAAPSTGSPAPMQVRDPTGTVTFLDGTTQLGTVRLRGIPFANPPKATLTVRLPVGDHRIVARYNGDDVYEAAVSPPVVVTVRPANSTVTLIAPAEPQVGPITLTAQVSCTAGTPTGTVTFLVVRQVSLLGRVVVVEVPLGDPVPLSGGPTATATLTVAQGRLQPGRHTIVARYNGDGTCDALDSEPKVVVVAPRCVIRLTVSPSNPFAGQPIRLTAVVTCTAGTPMASGAVGTQAARGAVGTPAEGAPVQGDPRTENVTLQELTPTGTVTFFDGTTILGTVPLSGGATATASLTIDSLSPGSHTLSARYNGSGPFADATAESSVTITVRPPKPPLPVTGPSLPANLAAGVLLLLTGTALVFASYRRRRTHHTIG